MNMPKFLRNLRFRAIALVDKGANPDAHVVLAKRDDTITTDSAETRVQPIIPEVSHMPDPREAHDEVQKQALAQLAEITKVLEQTREEKKALAVRLEKIEDDKERDQFIAKAREFDGIPGVTADDFASLLRKMYAPLTAEERTKVDAMFRSAASTIKTSTLFSEIGVGGAAASLASAYGKLERMVDQEIQKDGKLSRAQAMAHVLKTPEGKRLYRDYDEERAEAARRVK